MQVLAGLGMKLSENLIGPHHENPDGFFEDAEIVELHKQLFADLGAKPIYPLPQGWLSSDVVRPYYEKTKGIVEKNLEMTSGIWGFKDPRVTSILPLWLGTFKSMWVIPVFVLAVREPGAAIRSLVRQTGLPGELAELIWLFRVCDALHNCSGNCAIVHYEEWFSAPQKTADDLAAFVGLNAGAVTVLDQIIKPNLNRSIHEEYKIGNSMVRKLYDVLKDCRGSNFDRDRLMACVRECCQAIDDFSGWSSVAAASVASEARDTRIANLRREVRSKDELIGKMKEEFEGELSRRVESVAVCKNQFGTMTSDLEALTVQNNAYLKQIKELHEKCESLSVRVNTQAQGGGRQARDTNPRVAPAANGKVGAAKGAGAGKAKKGGIIQAAMVDENLGRPTRIWRRFKRDPHRYLENSKHLLLRPLRHLFKKQK